jgi:VanZ family protein
VNTRIGRWGPVIAMMALIFWLSGESTLPAPPGGLSDKQAHALVYGALAALWYRALAHGCWRELTWPRGLHAAIGATAYGATDELHQVFVPGRTADSLDLLYDATGAVCAVVIVWGCGIIAGRLQPRHADPSP